MDTAELSATSRAQAAVHGARPRRHPFLGGLLVKDRLINQAQLDRVLALQQETEPRPLLGQMLVDQKLITPHELNTVLGKYRREHLLGDILIETNLLTPAQLEVALVSQRRTGVPLGETLIQLGYITERQLKNALSIQLRIAFVDLDRRSIDPALAAVISERYARRHRAIPIAWDDERIVLAMDDPTDADVVAEVRSCTGRRIDVATATADTLERALSRLYGDRGELATAHPPMAPMAPMAATSAETARGAVAEAMATTHSAGHGASAPSGRDAAPRSDGDPAVALEAVWSKMEAVGQRFRNWDSRIDAVDSLLRERAEQRSRIERLIGDLRENRSALARASHELDARIQALARLETEHQALLRDREALARVLSDLQERHDALLQDRDFAIERVAVALRRLRP